MEHRTVFGFSLFSVVMALLFAVEALVYGSARIGVPVSLAFMILAVIGSSTARNLKRMDERLRALESAEPSVEPVVQMSVDYSSLPRFPNND